MNKKLIKINYNDTEPIARELFIKASSLCPSSKNHKVLLEEALQVLLDCKADFNTEAIIIPLNSNTFFDSIIHMNKSNFSCTAFEQISKDDVVMIYFYILSLGECKPDTKNKAEQYYAELWINSFLEAGRQVLRKEIERIEFLKKNGYYISCSFGPGSYGMSPDKITDMLEEIDNSMLGRAINRDGAFSKKKVSGGFYFVTKSEGVLPPLECRDCIGHEKGCLFCGGKNLIPSRNACMELLRSYGTPQHVVRHCLAVTDTALRMAEALNLKGHNINIPLLEASALLHDIARVEENHGVRGAIVLERSGYRQVAKLVRGHMYYATDPEKGEITEQDLLCLADRMVREDEYVGLDIRMRTVLEKLIALGVDTDRVRHRLEENQRLKERIEQIIGSTIDTLMK